MAVFHMIDKLGEAFAFRQEALGLRHQRQEILAANIANADTPSYKARDIDFRKELSRALGPDGSGRSGLDLKLTSERHLPGGTNGARSMPKLLYRVPEQPSLDGNTVDMERERAQFTDNSVRYQASLTLMSNYIRGLQKSMQPE